MSVKTHSLPVEPDMGPVKVNRGRWVCDIFRFFMKKLSNHALAGHNAIYKSLSVIFKIYLF